MPHSPATCHHKILWDTRIAAIVPGTEAAMENNTVIITAVISSISRRVGPSDIHVTTFFPCPITKFSQNAKSDHLVGINPAGIPCRSIQKNKPARTNRADGSPEGQQHRIMPKPFPAPYDTAENTCRQNNGRKPDNNTKRPFYQRQFKNHPPEKSAAKR